ncbi:MAG: hypothetical protein J2P57_16610, partial [Acidimicrobiaceae bacterium]|nr:hypothetical protein [Acidimicrobiaceae bacterium]
MSAMVSLGLVGVGAGSTAARLLNGQAWLANARTGTVSQANGYSGKVSAAVRTGLQAGDPFTVVQRPDGAYVVDERTGRLVRIDGAKLQPSNGSAVPGLSVPNLQVITGGGRTYVVDHSAGKVQQVNPGTLRPVGSLVSLHSPISGAVVDPRGDLWVAVPGQGAVTEVNGSSVTGRQIVGQDDDAISVADTSACVASVDASSGVAKCVSKPGPVAHFQGGADQIPVLADSPSSPSLVSVEGTQATLVNMANGTSRTTSLPQGAHVAQAVVNGDLAYLLDAASQQIDTVSLANASLGQTVSPPGGVTDLTVSGGLVFANNANGAKALAIAPGGSQVPIQKYDPENPFAGVGPAPQGSAGTGTTASPASSSQVFTPAVAPSNGGGTGPIQVIPGQQGGSSAGAQGQQGTPTVPTTLQPPTRPTAPPPPPPTPTPPPAPPTTHPIPSPTTTLATPPGQPLNVKATPGNGAVSVTWSAPASGTVSSYSVTSLGHTTQVLTTTATFTVPNGTQDCITVQAVGPDGAGPLAQAPCVTPAAPVTAPSAPGLSLASTFDSITATVSAPTNNGGAPITSYAVSLNGGSSRTLNGGSTTFNGLNLGTSYTVTATTTNLAGTSQAARASISTKAPSTQTVYTCHRPDLQGTVVPESYIISSTPCGSGNAYHAQYSGTVATWQMVSTGNAPGSPTQGSNPISWTAPSTSLPNA